MQLKVFVAALGCQQQLAACAAVVAALLRQGGPQRRLHLCILCLLELLQLQCRQPKPRAMRLHGSGPWRTLCSGPAVGAGGNRAGTLAG